jgi:hypothetical protein
VSADRKGSLKPDRNEGSCELLQWEWVFKIQTQQAQPITEFHAGNRAPSGEEAPLTPQFVERMLMAFLHFNIFVTDGGTPSFISFI